MSTTTASPLPPAITVSETPSKAAANKLAKLDFSKDSDSNSDSERPSLLAKMQASVMPVSSKDASRTHPEITLDSGKVLQHASGDLTRRKYVGDLSITDDSQEPLLQETEQRFVLFPIKYHEVSCERVSLRDARDRAMQYATRGADRASKRAIELASTWLVFRGK